LPENNPALSSRDQPGLVPHLFMDLHLFLISPIAATWPKTVREHREENECVVQTPGLGSEVLSLNPDCVA